MPKVKPRAAENRVVLLASADEAFELNVAVLLALVQGRRIVSPNSLNKTLNMANKKFSV
jgi:hypothetical protein